MEPNQQSSDQSAAPLTPESVEQTVVATKVNVTSLLTQGIQFVTNNPSYFAWYLAPFLVITILSSELVSALTLDLANNSMLLQGTIAIVMLIVAIIGIINMVAIIHGVHQVTTPPIFTQSFAWAKTNFFKVFWTNIVEFSIVIVGLLLLIIPGMIATFFVAFATFAFYHHGAIGFQAVRASFSFVKKNGWNILFKQIKLGVLVFVISIPLIMLFGVLMWLVQENVWFGLVVEVVIQVIFTLLSVALIFVWARLYEAYGGAQQGS